MKDSLKEKTLVLNKLWVPIRIITVRRAIIATVREKAWIIDPKDYTPYKWASDDGEKAWVDIPVQDNDEYIVTTRKPVKLPRIIVLSSYDKIPKYDVKLNKKNLYVRDKGTCQYTGRKLSYKEATADHIMPKSRGGKNTWNNVVLSSRDINVKKGNRTPEEAGVKLMTNPIKPKWSALFTLLTEKYPECWEPFLTNMKG